MLTKKEDEIFRSIKIASENDPNRPEFPPENPRWPSTPTKKIKVKGFENIYLKDEGINPTGTHKDRMAWEIIVTYKQLLRAKKEGRISELPQMSIISSGSAANAIQQMLKKYHLPNLKVLMDYHVDQKIKKSLEKIGCEIYETDLSKSSLSQEEILKLTHNQKGIDITSENSLEPISVFYDWMSYDILNQNADYIFIPYGTGQLYENILNVAVRESKAMFLHDPRLKVKSKELKKMNFVGATTNNPKTKADKLYSPHLPFTHLDTSWIKNAIRKGLIGEKSNVYTFRDLFLQEAEKILKKNKINAEPSGAAGLALLVQMKEKIPKRAKILIINTGKTKYQ